MRALIIGFGVIAAAVLIVASLTATGFASIVYAIGAVWVLFSGALLL